jgi:hypothetical protein
MKTRNLIATAVLASAVLATPTLAQEVVQQTVVVTGPTTDLDQFIGRNLFGVAHANLGVVSAANPYTGVIGVTGRHGEYALISGSMLTHDGMTLYAPTLTVGDIKLASEAQWAHPGAILAAPHVIVVEPPVG